MACHRSVESRGDGSGIAPNVPPPRSTMRPSSKNANAISPRESMRSACATYDVPPTIASVLTMVGAAHSSDSIHELLLRFAYTCSTCSAAVRMTAHLSYVVSWRSACSSNKKS
eukprot:361100-Chlamydomonas_euryale.AAC.15